jgi:hypothetical protein
MNFSGGDASHRRLNFRAETGVARYYRANRERPRGDAMKDVARFAATWLLAATTTLVLLGAGPAAAAQKQGGILQMHLFDSPASMSILEESTRAAEQPMMAVMSNLVLYDQHAEQNTRP